jgi:hypothetical protein
MADIIQIYKSAGVIEKPGYNTAWRKRFLEWRPLVSASGFVDGDTLYLPAGSRDEHAVAEAGLILITDVKDMSSGIPENPNNGHPRQEPLLTAFRGTAGSVKFEIFEFRRAMDGVFELWLNYRSIIGIPKRENHKIAELREGKPVRYMINGKDDFSLSGRLQRTFYEFDYIIEYLGRAGKIEYLPESNISTSKVPPSGCKTVNERKILR